MYAGLVGPRGVGVESGWVGNFIFDLHHLGFDVDLIVVAALPWVDLQVGPDHSLLVKQGWENLRDEIVLEVQNLANRFDLLAASLALFAQLRDFLLDMVLLCVPAFLILWYRVDKRE